MGRISKGNVMAGVGWDQTNSSLSRWTNLRYFNSSDDVFSFDAIRDVVIVIGIVQIWGCLPLTKPWLLATRTWPKLSWLMLGRPRIQSDLCSML
jgi:hypothetical protein